MDRELITDLGRDLASDLDRVRASSDAVRNARARFLAGEPSGERGADSRGESKNAQRVSSIAPRRDSYFRPRKGRAAVQTLAFAALLVAAAIALFFSLRKEGAPPVPLAFTVVHDGAMTEAGSAGALLDVTTETPLLFTDGTKVTLRPTSKARVTDVDHRGARVILESGSLHAAVTHKNDTRWNVDAGPFEVHVTGTRFVVEWDPTKQELDVTLEEGSVVVTGCGTEPHAVKTGEALHLACTAHATPTKATISGQGSAPTPQSPTPSAPLPDARTTTPTPTATATSTTTPTSTPTKELFAAIAPTASSDTPRPAPTAAAEIDDALVNAQIRDLMRWADDARYAGRLDEATSMLEAVRKRAPGTDEAANASFELGRIAFDGRASYSRAATAFETYLHERPNGRFAREALGRAIEAHQRAGDLDAATRSAKDYLDKYPSGPHAVLAHRVLGDQK